MFIVLIYFDHVMLYSTFTSLLHLIFFPQYLVTQKMSKVYDKYMNNKSYLNYEQVTIIITNRMKEYFYYTYIFL